MTKSLSCSDDDTFQHKNSNKTTKFQPDDTSEATTSNSVHHENTKPDNTSDSDTENLMPPTDMKNISDTENQDTLSGYKSSGEEETQQNTNSNVLNVNITMASTHLPDSSIIYLQHQNQLLLELKEMLVSQISAEKSEIVFLKYCLANNHSQMPETNTALFSDTDKLDEIMDLLVKENRILKIKKTDLVREIMETQEACIALKSKLFMSSGVR